MNKFINLKNTGLIFNFSDLVTIEKQDDSVFISFKNQIFREIHDKEDIEKIFKAIDKFID